MSYKTQYFISDGAYNHLLELAVQQTYIKKASTTHKGFSEFLHDLPIYNSIYHDNRPDYIKDYHEACLKRMSAPRWTNPIEPRRVRCFNLDEDTKVRYINVAKLFHIILDTPFLNGRTTILSPPSIISQVLEGIGLQWIVPEKLPVKGLLDYVHTLPKIS